jgi:hypothetical protein
LADIKKEMFDRPEREFESWLNRIRLTNSTVKRLAENAVISLCPGGWS